VTTSTSATGSGGDIDIDLDRVIFRDGALIIARSQSEDASAGDAGGVKIHAQDFYMEDGTVSVRSAASDAGDIEITADNGIELFGSGSTIEANVGGGAGTSGGNIALASNWVVIDGDSSVVAQAVGGQGGNIEINTQGLFAYPGATISASSEFGLSGNVQINTPDTNLTGALAALSETYLEEIALARNQCAPGGEASRGSFVLGGGTGIPEAPDAPLPGFSLAGRRMLQ
jgi:large exoprotein involved in heme utilization and adhesion